MILSADVIVLRLERGYKYELLTEHDLGVTIDLILPETYDPEEGVSDMLDPSDEKLLEEEFNTIHDKKRTMRHSQVSSRSVTIFQNFECKFCRLIRLTTYTKQRNIV